MPTKSAVQKKDAKAKKVKAKKDAKAPKAPKTTAAKRFNSPVNEEDRALFLNHLPKIADLKAKLNSANANLRNAYKTAKADGFLKGDFDTAFMIQGADGEKAKKAAIARDLTIAKWLGCDLGSQLDMFVQDERVPATDRAFEEGKVDAMQNRPAKPSYDPATEQYKQYLEGFHSVSEARINGGIKPLDKTVTEKAKTEQQKAQDAKAFENGGTPSSGVAMTREQYKKQQAQADGAGDLPN